MMKGSKGYWLIIIMLVPGLLVSCSTNYIADIKPAGAKTFIESGRVVSSENKSGIEVYVTYLKNEQYLLMFDVQVANKSDYPVAVTQSSIFLVPMANLSDNRNVTNAKIIVTAVDPEVPVSEIEGKISGENLSYGISSFFRVSLMILGGIVAILTVFADDNSSESARETADDMSSKQSSASVEHNIVIEELTLKKQYIEKYSLKDTLSKPGEHVYGLVMFPADDPELLKFFKIVVLLNGTFFEFPFEAIIGK